MKIRFLDFWAPWCGPCKMMAPILEELEKQWGDSVEVVKINVDENPTEAQKYRVLSIPTYIIEKDGVEVGRKIGFTPKTEINKLIPV